MWLISALLADQLARARDHTLESATSTQSLSNAPSTTWLLERLQHEGATDELLMALLAIREASGAWMQVWNDSYMYCLKYGAGVILGFVLA